MLGYILIAVVAYLLGNISTSYIIAKRIAGIDIRTQGSGNAGSTNVLRTLGKKAGLLTFLGDVLKGALAVLVACIVSKFMPIDTLTAKYVAVLGVVAGHNWPVFLGFRGGKGVATSLGAMLAVHPVAALTCFAVFGVVVLFTKYVSLGSVIGIASSPFIVYLMGKKEAVLVTIFLALSVIYTHRENLKRVFNGTERKIGEKKN